MGTCDALHPGGLINAQVVVDDFQDVAQDEAEVFRCDLGAAGPCAGRQVLRSPLPPVRQVVAEHWQDHLNDMGHLHVPGARLGQAVDVLHQAFQLGDVRTHLFHLVWHPQN